MPDALQSDHWTYADALSDGLYSVDRQGLCTFVNAAALALLGYASSDDLLGRNMHRMIHHTRPDGSVFPVDACPLLHTLTSGRPVRLDNELLWREDGTSFIAQYSSFPTYDAGGAIVGSVIVFVERSVTPSGTAVGSGRDIESIWGSAERRRAEELLRTSEAKFRSLADSIPQLAWMTDPTGSIEWYNRRWFEYTGSTLEQMRGWGWRDVHHPDHLDRVVERLKSAFAAGLPWEDTFPLRGADGTYRWFLSRAMPIHAEAGDDGAGRFLGWFGTNTDITEIRETEERLNAAKEAAEEANRTKSDFIANMSHELRTPLSAIIGYSEMMQEEIADEANPADLTPDLHKIESNARHLLGLINDVLDLSKIESGKMEVYAEAFDVAAMLRDVVSTVQGLVGKKNNTLVLDLGDDLGSMHSDVTKIRQMLLNLLSNAAKFTEAGTITLKGTRIAGAGSDDWLAFRVSDSGIGMSEEQLAKLFLRFSQADASTTRKFGGTGLGLSITKAFSVMLGGDIAVESAEGQGSTFTVMVPAVAREADAEHGGSPPFELNVDGPVPSAEQELVLVIDDDPAQRELMTRFLAREGFAARTASDGASGIALARELKPRAILLDVMMPGMDGWSVLSALKADPELETIPVVMITFVSERGLALSLGAAEYVMKPVQWERFKQVMDRFRPAAGAVLVVDDDGDSRSRLRSALERDGWTVVEAGDGRQALDEVARATPQLVLLDLNMPVMDGFTFLSHFRALPGCTDIPVVVLTASDLSNVERKRLRGASQVLNKGNTNIGELAKHLRGLAEDVSERS